MIYEVITDPEVRITEGQQRSREGQYKRHIRRRANRAKTSQGMSETGLVGLILALRARGGDYQPARHITQCTTNGSIR